MSADDYETIVYEHDFQKEIMLKALDIVKTFIQRKKLVLVGGMAIDIALRSIGKRLYKDNKMPDYDFYSAEHHRDAYDLGIILAKECGGVSVINAFHVSTMRVRVNFQEAADISYIPQNILSKIPTINYMGFVVIHPHYQMIDQHRALSLPYEMPPLETVFGRWKKDITRYTLLAEAFPLEQRMTNDELIEYTVSISDLNGHCLSGLPSLLYWMAEAKADGYVDEEQYIEGCCMEINEKTIKLTMPQTAAFTLLADDMPAAVKTICNSISDDYDTKKYRPITDKINERTTISSGNHTYTIINNHGDLRSACAIGKKYHVSNLQEVMGYLLTMGILYDDGFCINAYLAARSLLYFASNSSDNNKYYKYLPSVEYYGNSNIYMANVVSKQKTDVQLKKQQRTLITPKNAYPKKPNFTIKAELYEFDPTKEKLFQFDGAEITGS